MISHDLYERVNSSPIQTPVRVVFPDGRSRTRFLSDLGARQDMGETRERLAKLLTPEVASKYVKYYGGWCRFGSGRASIVFVERDDEREARLVVFSNMEYASAHLTELKSRAVGACRLGRLRAFLHIRPPRFDIAPSVAGIEFERQKATRIALLNLTVFTTLIPEVVAFVDSIRLSQGMEGSVFRLLLSLGIAALVYAALTAYALRSRRYVVEL